MKRRVAILFGGRSAEHEISCISARSVMDALDPDRYDVIPIGITKEGAWRLMPGGPPAIEGAGSEKRLPGVTASAGEEVALSQGQREHRLVASAIDAGSVDVVFPVLHGPYGEDGAVQGLLEMAGVAYVGAGVLGSAIGMDKAVQKTLARAAGLPVVDWIAVRERDWSGDREGVEARAEALGYPLFAKPANLGSSVGISKVHATSELMQAVDEALAYDAKAILERSVEGAREIECAVLGNDDPVASVAGEIVPSGHEFYDYEAKYADEQGSELIIPAVLPPVTLEEIQRLAVAAFRAIDCAGMARVDFFITRDGALILNEVNTIPGFTPISMYPKLWEASSVSYPELIDRLIELALERHAAEGKKGTGI